MEQVMLLWVAQRVALRSDGFRTAPSAGGTYPLDAYVVAKRAGSREARVPDPSWSSIRGISCEIHASGAFAHAFSEHEQEDFGDVLFGHDSTVVLFVLLLF